MPKLPKSKPSKEILMTAMQIYETLSDSYDNPRWWSDDPYQIMVQAVLVQNTAWTSVEKVTQAVKNNLTPERISALSSERLEALIRPCGFSKAKAATIQRLTAWYGRYQYNAESVEKIPKDDLRTELLGIKGIGAETADVLLVYAFHKASFIIDAYTRRFLKRLGYPFKNDMQIRTFFEQELPADYRIYGWYHWLILDHGIKKCKKTPVCDSCCFTNCAFLHNRYS
ncbi:MAG: endonuclease [Oscillospiraceae bacterium]|nr:endonuclease [Oscillospiraceae bacterium]